MSGRFLVDGSGNFLVGGAGDFLVSDSAGDCDQCGCSAASHRYDLCLGESPTCTISLFLTQATYDAISQADYIGYADCCYNYTGPTSEIAPDDPQPSSEDITEYASCDECNPGEVVDPPGHGGDCVQCQVAQPNATLTVSGSSTVPACTEACEELDGSYSWSTLAAGSHCVWEWRKTSGGLTHKITYEVRKSDGQEQVTTVNPRNGCASSSTNEGNSNWVSSSVVCGANGVLRGTVVIHAYRTGWTACTALDFTFNFG